MRLAREVDEVFRQGVWLRIAMKVNLQEARFQFASIVSQEHDANVTVAAIGEIDG